MFFFLTVYFGAVFFISHWVEYSFKTFFVNYVFSLVESSGFFRTVSFINGIFFYKLRFSWFWVGQFFFFLTRRFSSFFLGVRLVFFTDETFFLYLRESDVRSIFFLFRGSRTFFVFFTDDTFFKKTFHRNRMLFFLYRQVFFPFCTGVRNFLFYVWDIFSLYLRSRAWEFFFLFTESDFFSFSFIGDSFFSFFYGSRMFFYESSRER